jgi:hypothetical protein
VATNTAFEDKGKRLLFESVKEHRETYFVEYKPPSGRQTFATLNLVFMGTPDWPEVETKFKLELRHWIERYPVPVMAWAFDDQEDSLREPETGRSWMVAWPGSTTNEIEYSLDYNELPSSPEHDETGADWAKVYSDIPYETLEQMRERVKQEARERLPYVRLLRLALAKWTFISIAGALIIGFFGPIWFSIIGLAYSIWKATSAAAELMGWKKYSKSKAPRLEEERQIQHYVYHCERNPEGFQRLVRENLNEDIRQQVAQESKSIKAKTPK